MLGAASLPEFGDFDDENVYERCHRAAVRGDTKNFVIEFDSANAHAAHDLSDVSIKQLLELEVDHFANYVHKINQDTASLHFRLDGCRLTFTNISEQSMQVLHGCMSMLPL